MIAQKKIPFLLLISFLLASILCSLGMGAIEIPFKSLISILLNRMDLQLNGFTHTAQQEAVFFTLRMPRMLMGLLIGGTLAISGAAIQGMFRNPLAEPGLIGISSGASLFAVLMIVLETKIFSFVTASLGYYALAFAAFLGAMVTTFLVYRFSVKQGRTQVTSLLLIGIAINALVGACTGLLTFVASDEQLRNITFWSLGSLGAANWQMLSVLFPFTMTSIIGLSFFGKALNGMALGESQASHLGIPIQGIKKLIILFAAIGVGASVAFSGIIGFISLVVPHLLRMGITGDNRFVLPASVLLGASMLLIADLLARTLVAPSELPIGILTAFIGVPIFIFVILRELKGKNSL